MHKTGTIVMRCISKIHEWNLQNQRVFVRADLNIPLLNGMILDDHRLYGILPTLNLIAQKGGKIILATHIGRPKKPTEKLTSKILIPWFQERGFAIDFASTPQQAYEKSKEKNDTIVLLENLRFFPGEKRKEEEFAQQLAATADYYVDDAFAALHRDDASIALLPTFFEPKKRSIGLLVAHELQLLTPLKKPVKPFVLIVGGGKVADKLPLLEGFLDSVSTILMCPAFVFSFMKVEGKEVGKSLVYSEAASLIKDFLAKAKKKNVKIIFPKDYMVASGSIDGPLSRVKANAIPKDGFGITIGPETVKEFAPHIRNAQTILYNCAMGFFSRPETLEGTEKLLKLVGLSKAYTVIAGGESVAATNYFGLQKKMNYLTTGGGAVLTYLAGKDLPGLEVLCENP